LRGIIDEFFSDFSQNTELIKIDRLVLDLGVFSEVNFEMELENTLRAQLPVILAKLLKRPNEEIKQLTTEESGFQLLEFFLKNGFFPWWAPKDPKFNLDTLIEKLIQKYPVEVKDFFEFNIRSAEIRNRLEYQISKKTLRSVSQIITGENAVIYDWYLKQLEFLHQHPKIRSISKKNYRAYLDQLFLAYLGQGVGSEISPQFFGIYLLENMEIKYDIPGQEIQKYYQKRISKNTVKKEEQKWLQSIAEWVEGNHFKGTKTKRSKVQIVLQFLETGIIPLEETWIVSVEDIESLILELNSQQKPGHIVWIKELKKLLASPNVLQRMEQQLSVETLNSIHVLLYGKRVFREIENIRRETKILTDLPHFPVFLKKQFNQLFQSAVSRYFLSYQKQQEFVKDFLLFFRKFFEEKTQFSWENYWEDLSRKDQEILQQSNILLRLFQLEQAQQVFVGNLYIPEIQLWERLNEIINFKDYFPSKHPFIQERDFKELLEKGKTGSLKDSFLHLIRSKTFFELMVTRLSIIELANIAKIIFESRISVYTRSVQLISRFLKESPLPKGDYKSSLSQEKWLWLGLLKAESQKNYQGNRSHKFWQSWIFALAELLEISEQALWKHLQNIPKDIQAGLPQFSKDTLFEPPETPLSGESDFISDKMVISQNELIKELQEGDFWTKLQGEKVEMQQADWNRISKVLFEIADENPEIFKKTFSEKGKVSKFLKSDLPNLSLSFLEKASTVLNTTNVKVEEVYIHDVSKILQKFGSILGLSNQKIEHYLQSGILMYWVEDHSSFFDPAVFLERVIHHFCSFAQIKENKLWTNLASQRDHLDKLDGDGDGLLKMLLHKFDSKTTASPTTKKIEPEANIEQLNLSPQEVLDLFFDAKTLPGNLSLSKFDRLLQKEISEVSTGIQKVIFEKLANFSKLHLFRKLSPTLMKEVERHVFRSVQQKLKPIFEDLKIFFQNAKVLPLLSTQILERDLRIALFHPVAKSGLKIIPINIFMPQVLNVLASFYPCSKNDLHLDFAKVAKKRGLKFETEIKGFFKVSKGKGKALGAEESFLFFLESGVFPPGSKFNQIIDIENWLETAGSHFTEKFKSELINQYSDQKKLQRTFHQFSSKGIKALNRLLAGDQISILEQSLEQFKIFFEGQDYPVAIKRRLEETLSTGLLQFLVENPMPPFLPGDLFQVLLRHISEQYKLEVIATNEEVIISKTSMQKGEHESEKKINAEALLDFLKHKKFTSDNQFETIFDVEESLERALINYPEILYSVWKKYLYLPKLVETITETFSVHLVDLLIEKVNEIVGGKSKSVIRESHDLWQKVANSEVFDSMSLEVYQKLMLKQLMEEETENPSIYVKNILLTMARQQKMDLPSFIIKAEPFLVSNSFLKQKANEILRILQKENADKISNKKLVLKTKKETGDKEQELIFSNILEYLTSGSFKAESLLQSPKKVEESVLFFLEENPQKVWLAFKEIAHLEKVLERFEDNFSIAALSKMVIAFEKERKVKLTDTLKDWEAVPWQNVVQGKDLKILKSKENRIIALDILFQVKEKSAIPTSFFKGLFEALARKNSEDLRPFWKIVKIPLRKYFNPRKYKTLELDLEKELLARNLLEIEKVMVADFKDTETRLTRTPKPNDKLAAVTSFLEMGKLPWWGSVQSKKELGPALIALAKTYPKELKVLMAKAWLERKVQKRVLKTIEPKMWPIISRSLYGNYFLLINAVAELIEITIKTVPEVTLGKTSLLELKWSAILEYIWSVDNFSSEPFIVRTLNKVRQKTKIGLEKWQTLLVNIVKDKVAGGALDYLRIKEVLEQWRHNPVDLNLGASDQIIVKDKISNAEEIMEPLKQKIEANKKHWDKDQHLLLETLQNIRHFLEYGAMPSKEAFSSKTEFFNTIRSLMRKHPDLLLRLLSHLTNNQAAILRMLSIFPKNLTQSIIRFLYAEKFNVIQKYWNDLMMMLPGILKRYEKTTLTEFFNYQVLVYFNQTRSGLFSVEKFLANLLLGLAKNENINPIILLQKIKESVHGGEVSIKASWPKIIPSLFQLFEGHLQKEHQQIKWDLESTGEEGKEMALYVNNAGLAVIAPFFARYFDVLGMISDGQFKDKEMAVRAVHLMQFVATGQNETAEPFLTFNKILCGLPLRTPVPKRIELTDKEKQTTKEMMAAILGHWKGMGTTSIEGLRGGFLIREGKLEWQNEGYWNLDVEKKSYDILMKSLPWSISIINYSWMENRIQVIWI
jgi:hypothetical protein